MSNATKLERGRPGLPHVSHWEISKDVPTLALRFES